VFWNRIAGSELHLVVESKQFIKYTEYKNDLDKNINWKIKSIIRITMGIAAISLSIYFGVPLSLLYF
jgi:hypothetical protein